jgi:hypothetical protein
MIGGWIGLLVTGLHVALGLSLVFGFIWLFGEDNLGTFLLVMVPVVLWLAWRESGKEQSDRPA